MVCSCYMRSSNFRHGIWSGAIFGSKFLASLHNVDINRGESWIKLHTFLWKSRHDTYSKLIKIICESCVLSHELKVAEKLTNLGFHKSAQKNPRVSSGGEKTQRQY